jgi:hypothetical protein
MERRRRCKLIDTHACVLEPEWSLSEGLLELQGNRTVLGVERRKAATNEGAQPMRERVKPMKEPRKPHGDMINPNDPTDRPEAERQREQQQRKERPEGERRE